ncbi:histidine kinase, partial [Aureobasidium melanogenum]
MPKSQRKLADWTLSDATSPWFHFVKHFDWSNTPFGAIETWSLELRRSTAKIMNSPDPRILIFGDQRAIIYNEAFAAVIGRHHPQCLGSPLTDVQVDKIFEVLWDMSLTAYDNGRGARRTRQELLLERGGSMEQTFWNIFLSPLPGLDGYCDSAVGEFTDVTDLVVQDQRRSQGLDILDSFSKVESLPELWSQFLGALDKNAPDISYAMVYTAFDHSCFVRSEGLPTPDITPHHETLQSATSYFVKQYQLSGSLGLSERVLEPVIDISIAESSGTPSLSDAFREALDKKDVMILADEALPDELSVHVADSGTVRCASILPISNLDGKPLAFVVLGLDPRRPFTEQMSRFVHCIHEAICKQAILVTLPEDQQQFQRKYEETTMALSTELRLSILKAKKKEEKFLRIAKSAPLGMYLYSPKERTIQVNDAYLKITGTTKEDLDKTTALELPWLQTVSEEYMDVAIKEWQHLMTEKMPSAIEYKIRDSSDNPTSRWVSATSFPDLDEHGEVYLIHGWLVDISDRLAKDTLLAQRLEDALETKTATEHFLDMVSHEMRNPLSAIFQCSDEILNTIQTHNNQSGVPSMTTTQLKGLEDAAHTIALCAQHQNGIFNDILTVSKLDSQLLTITPEKIRPVDIVQRALRMYGQEAKRSDIITSIDVQDTYTKHISEFVMADPNRLLQIIINLLTNAINHTRSCRERSIVISLGASVIEPEDTSNQIVFMPPTPRRSSSPLTPATEQDHFSAAFLSSCSGQDVYLHVAVQDTGCGLSESEMGLLFKRFSQPKTYGQYSGSGLGLFLSKELIELQAGRIGVTSTEGLGTTFSFYIKCRKSIEEPDSASISTSKSPRLKGHRPRMSRTEAFNDNDLEFTRQSSPVRGLHVLVVEDNPLNQRLVAKQLRNQGCTVHTADHGLDALEFLSKTNIASSSTPGTKLDIVLLDIEMPVMDGLTCIRKIRDLEQEGFCTRRVPVIAVTANARDEQMREALEAGMDDVVTKPFRIPELLVRMSEVVSGQHSA